VIGLTIAEAGELISEISLKYTTEYEDFSLDTVVVDQYPKAGEEIQIGGIIDLYLSSGTNNPTLSEETFEDR
jgi:beta-lactam-binding protein with PASTA domain